MCFLILLCKTLKTYFNEHAIRRENEVSEANLIFPEALRLEILIIFSNTKQPAVVLGTVVMQNIEDSLQEHPIRRENEVSEANLIFPEALRLEILI